MNVKKRIVRTLVAAGLVIAMTTGLAMASIGTGIVTGSSLRLRSEPNTSGRILTTLYKNTAVDVLEELDNGWYKVSYKNTVGYMSGEWLSVTRTEDAPADTETRQGTVNAGPLNIRSGPGISYKKVGSLKKGTVVTVLESANGWYKVTDGSTTGYVSDAYVTVSDTVESSTQPPVENNTPAPGTSSGSEASEVKEGRVNAGPLNVRSGPGTSYAKVGTLKMNTLVTVVEQVNGWYKITSGDLTGYVSADYITPGSEPVSEPEQGMVTTGSLNVRSGPGTSYAKVGSLGRGAYVTVVDKVNGWYKITAGSLSGYVSDDYVIILDGTAVTSKVGQSAAAMAASLVGCRYVYGAEGPNTFDCSGLFYYIFGKLGYKISRGSSAQYRNNGVFVSKENIQPGDLVFFFDPKFDGSGGTLPTTHVGMYMGNNQFIHASTVSYKVQYDKLYGSYYGNYIVGFKRIG